MNRVPKFSLAVTLSFILLLTLATSALALTFAVVDTADDDAPPTSLSVSPSGAVFVAYDKAAGDDLYSAEWTGSSWTKTKVRGRIGVSCYDALVGPVIGLKPGGGQAIASACNYAQGDETFWSNKKASTWTTSIIGSLPMPYAHIGYYTSLDVCFDPTSHQPSVFFGDTNGEFAARFYHDALGWHEQDVTSPVDLGTGQDGPAVSCAYDPVSGQLAVAITGLRYSPGGLKYGTYDPSTKHWSVSGLGLSDALGIPSLAFAPDGAPSIGFQEGGTAASHLEVGTRPTSTWTFVNVDSSSTLTGVAPSLAFKGSLQRVAYYDQTNGDLRWATYNGTSWSISTLESTNDVGKYPSLAFSSAPQPYISYWDATKKDVRWARPS